MKFPNWIKPGLTGAGVGAIALLIVGFSWGGWMTSGSAEELSSTSSLAAVAAALTPYCVQNSQTDPQASTIMVELKEARPHQRRGIVEKAGWATPLGDEKPNRALAQACQIELTKET